MKDERPILVLIGSQTLGQGDDNVGAVIMTNFLRFLAEGETKPHTLILWNTGVKLVTNAEATIERAQALEYLKRLQERGCRILVCQTCLDHFGLRDRVQVGTISGMKEFVRLLTSGDYQILSV
ncbi:MAG: DsrE family protein [Armatimonadetes bacterium]|nr:DsrE family protein [Armatimonadota bacterium]MDW8122752.1 DsrE family protein [Armatimonadota bacterium]